MFIVRVAATLLTLILPEFLIAQTETRGKVTDINNEALPFATVQLFNSNTLQASTVTNDSGFFRIPCACRIDTSYILKITVVGFQPIVKGFKFVEGLDLHLVLLSDKSTLQNVTVAAAKPLISRKADRYVINVENSFLSNSSSALDLLQKSPGVWVDNNGSIRIRGNQPVMVMVNDVVQRMSEDELSEYLLTLKPENISRIEVIHTPPAEYESSGAGGIIHIILKKNQKTGLNGSLSGRLTNQGNDFLTSVGGSMDFKLKRLSLFASYSYTSDNNSSYGNAITIYPDSALFRSQTKRRNNNGRQQYRFGGVYDLASRQTIGLQVMESRNRLVNRFDTDLFFLSAADGVEGQAHADWTREPKLVSTTINYSWGIDTVGRSLKIIADHTNSEKFELNDLRSVYIDPLLNKTYRNNSPASTDIATAQADYTHPFPGNIDFKAGLKYATIKRDNTILREDFINGQWVKNEPGSNRFLYDERLMMAYFSFEKIITSTSVKIGLRAEDTRMRGSSPTSNQSFKRKYFGLFPSLFLLHTFNAERGNSVHLNYSRRLERPSFVRLNPYRLQLDDYSVSVGNPELLPQYAHKVEIGITYHNSLTASLYFVETKNVVDEIARPIAANIIQYQPRNFDNSTEVGFTGNAQTKILKNWNANNSISLFALAYRLAGSRNSQPTVSLKSVHTITLKKIIDINVIGYYRSAFVTGNTRFAELISCDGALARKILKQKGTLRVYFADIFNTIRDKNTTDFNSMHLSFYQKRQTQTFSVSFTYNFISGKKIPVQKIDHNNAEEKSRIGN